MNVDNNIYQIVHGTKGHMTVYGPGCHPQNSIWTEAKLIWTEAKLRSIYYFVGDRPVNIISTCMTCILFNIILYVFIFPIVFVSAGGQYFRILTGQYFSIWTGADQYNESIIYKDIYGNGLHWF
jgi:hypothetical protein